jgi:type VI secretion system secreted protein VgrG
MGGSDHVLSIKTTLGKDKLLVLRMEGRESLSKLSEYRVDLVGNVSLLGDHEEIDLHKLIGTQATVTMELYDEKRHFNAYVTRMSNGERHGRYKSYTMFLRPWLWFATRNKNTLVFQEKSVKDIVEEVLKPYKGTLEWKTGPGASIKYDYCVQYNETDFDFVSRLLEEAGIYYFFEHTDSKHTMVLIDTMARHKKKKGDGIKWSNSLKHEATSITDWFKQEEARSVKSTVSDHDYLSTATKLEESKPVPPKQASNKLGEAEVYEHPANAVQNQAKPEATPSSTLMTERAKVLMERLASMQVVNTGKTNDRDITVGATFELEEEGGALGGLLGGGDTKAGKYLVISATYRLEFADHEAIEDIKSIKRRRDGFIAEIVAISADDAPYRPERSTPRPVVHGPLTATVVGASGNEIETDKHGRVKVQFHWDRKGKKDQNSSCWVRVAQPWAGKGMGMWTVPRIGHEVVVNFIDGNPDRPLITGSVYNDVNMIAYELPKLATVSGWRSHSSKGGAADMYNELRFEDEKGKEYVWLQAQKDFYRSVKENAFDHVLKNETVKVKLTRKEVIGENWYVNVGKDVMHEFGKDLHTKVAADVFLTGGATYQMKIAKDLSADVGGDAGLAVKGKLQMKATGDMMCQGANVHIKGGSNVTIEAGSTLTLKAGGSSIVLAGSGITIDGGTVAINGGGGGGAATAASPTAPTEAKNQQDLTPAKETDYDKQFEDPIKPAGAAG